jgi:hypothetical protein
MILWARNDKLRDDGWLGPLLLAAGVVAIMGAMWWRAWERGVLPWQ